MIKTHERVEDTKYRKIHGMEDWILTDLIR